MEFPHLPFIVRSKRSEVLLTTVDDDDFSKLIEQVT